MSCEHVERDLDAYLDRELDAESATAVRVHLSGCAVCRRRVAEREALSRLVRAAPYAIQPRIACGHECWHRQPDPSRCVASSRGRPQRWWSYRWVPA